MNQDMTKIRVLRAIAFHLLKKKSKAFSNPKDKSVILTADTIVELNGQIIEKPQNVQDNRETLKKLSGTTHNVHTALCLKKDDVFYSGSQKTLVTFHGLSDHNIEQYIETFNPFDKAGGYSIQDGCGILVKHIEGCYFNVLGMPITLLRQMLSKIQLDLWDFLKKS